MQNGALFRLYYLFKCVCVSVDNTIKILTKQAHLYRAVLHPTFKTSYDHYSIINKKLRCYSEYCETSRISWTLLRYFRLPVHIHEDFGWEEVGSDAFLKFADYSQSILRIFTIAKL